MKERYNSEKELKKAMDNFQMPFDNEAFDAFSKELDKEDKKKRFVWWIFNNNMFIVLALLGVIALGLLFLHLSNSTEEIFSTNEDSKTEHTTDQLTSAHSDKSATIDENQEPTQLSNQNDSDNLKQQASASSNTNDIQSANNTPAITNQLRLENGSEKGSEESIDHENVQNSTHSSVSDNAQKKTPNNEGLNDGKNESTKTNSNTNDNPDNHYGNANSDNRNTVSIDQFSSPSLTGSVDAEATLDINKNREPLRSNIEGLGLLDLLSPSLLESNRKAKKLPFDKEIEPYKEKFKKYLYFNIGGGITLENNHGPFNELFKVRKTNEVLWRISAAYQINPTTSFELSFIQKNASVGFEMKDYIYRERSAKKISMLKLGMNNRIWNITPNVSLNMSHGLSWILAPSHINDFADTKNTYQAAPFPEGVTNINSEWQGLFEGTHILLSGGLNLDIRLSKNLDLNLGAEYTHGTKPVMSSDLNYIEGEGIIRNLQALSNSSFASASIGLKYSLKR